MTEAGLAGVHGRMRAELAAEGAVVSAVYACPHDTGRCACRKPGVGLFLQAKRDVPTIDFATSVVVGDSLSDLEASTRIGARGYLVAADGCGGPLLTAAAARGIPVAGVAPSLFDVVVRFVLPRAQARVEGSCHRAETNGASPIDLVNTDDRTQAALRDASTQRWRRVTS
jgi:hypothetical protein